MMSGRWTRQTRRQLIVIIHRSEGGLFEHVFVALQYINLLRTMDISNLDAPGDPNTRRRGIMFPSKKDIGTVFAPLTPNYTTMHLIVVNIEGHCPPVLTRIFNIARWRQKQPGRRSG